jgi:hypothetical protein
MAKGWTITVLAMRAGISHRTVQRAEMEVPVQVFTADAVARALGVDFEDLTVAGQQAADMVPHVSDHGEPEANAQKLGVINISLSKYVTSNSVAPEKAAQLFDAILQLLKLGFSVRLTAGEPDFGGGAGQSQ